MRAGLVARAEEWAWSSARAHAAGGGAEGAPLLAPGRPFGGCRPDPLTDRPLAWAEWLARRLEGEAEAVERLPEATRLGRPCGVDGFAEELEAQLGRRLTTMKRGPKPRDEVEDATPEIPGSF